APWPGCHLLYWRAVRTTLLPSHRPVHPDPALGHRWEFCRLLWNQSWFLGIQCLRQFVLIVGKQFADTQGITMIGRAIRAFKHWHAIDIGSDFRLDFDGQNIALAQLHELRHRAINVS